MNIECSLFLFVNAPLHSDCLESNGTSAPLVNTKGKDPASLPGEGNRDLCDSDHSEASVASNARDRVKQTVIAI